MEKTEINTLISKAVAAMHNGDFKESLRAVGYLAAAAPDDVTEELGLRILDAKEERTGKEITQSAYLTDPQKAYELIAALESQDIDAVHAVVGSNYSDLLVSMLTTLAALTDN